MRLSVVVEAITEQLNAAIEQARQHIAALGDETRQMAGAESEASEATGQHADQLNRSADASERLNRQTESLRSGYERLTGILAALGLGLGVQELLETADAFADLQARIKLATGEGSAFTAGLEGVKRVAAETSSDLSATADLFTSIANATKDLGTGQQEQLALTKAIGQAVQISGASAEAAEGAISQLGQALASGALRGDEFNSVNEATPRVMQALADGLGVARGALRGMAEDGKLTSDVLIGALLTQSDRLQEEFSQLPLTVGRAMTDLANQWMIFIGGLDSSTGATRQAAEAIKFIADNLGELATVVRIAGEAWLIMKGVDVVAALNARATASFAAANALRDQVVATNQATQAQQANTAATAQANATGVTTRTQLIAEAQARREQAMVLVQQTNAQVAAAQEALRGTYLSREQLAIEMQLERQRMAAQLNAEGRAASATRMAELGQINAQVAREQALAQERLNLAMAQSAAASTAASAASRSLASAQAATTASMAATGAAAMGMLSRLGQLGLIASMAWLLKDALVSVGTAMGEWLAKKVTGIDLEKQEAEAHKREAEAAEARAQKKRQLTAEQEKNTQATTGATEAMLKLVAAYDKAKESGDKTAEALKKVQEAMRLDSTEGINEAVGALRALEVQGKATGQEVRKALQDELGKVDLIVFRANAKAAFDLIPLQMEEAKKELEKKKIELDKYIAQPGATQAGIEQLQKEVDKAQGKLRELRNEHEQSVSKMAIVMDATLNEAIRRTGLTYDQLKGKTSEMANSAVNDVDLIVSELGRLKQEGVDTGLALGAGLARAIKSADTPEALDAVKSRVIGLSSELEKPVRDGLLNQANQQAIDLKNNLDKLKPGINSTAEAFHEFGMKSREEFAVIAKTQQAAFLEMEKSGEATKDQLVKAFMTYAQNAIAANGGVADSFVRSKAAALGLKVETDEYGKNAKVTMEKVKSSTDAVSDSTKQIRKAVNGVSESYGTMASAAEQASKAAVQSIQEQIQKADELSSKLRGAKVNSAGNLGGISMLSYGNSDAVAALLREKGYSGNNLASLAHDIFQGSIDEMKRQPLGQQSLTNAAIVQREVDRIMSYNKANGTSIGSPSDYGINAVTPQNLADNRPTSTTRLEIVGPNGKTVTASVANGEDSELIGMLTQLGLAKKVS